MTRIDEFTYLIDYFFQEKIPVNVYEGKSGYNNLTRYLERDGETYILRIYETHQDETKVALEHEVLLKLNEIPDLPFAVPAPVCRDNMSFTRLPSNKIGCVYHYIEGDNPVLHTADVLFSFGQSTAILLQALEKIKLTQPLIYRPYYEIEHTHPNCPIEKVEAWCNNPPDIFTQYKKELAWISSQLVQFKQDLPNIKHLPHQIIHGDLNGSNVLVDSNQKINAILDFEFTTRDLRVMEVAVCIADIISEETNEDEYLERVSHFVSGFKNTMKLTKAELEALPLLIQLRRLDVFLHFLGRYEDKLDDASVLEEQISKVAAYEDWLPRRAANIFKLWI
ncbi:phosphotransferase [Bacillus alkalicellulosilyticus]|uniref:phosphotransferase n=1 Tax=Alkalihalobacterium alkalicellulosilyticum TaxID=1912214 RepID=UPI001482FA66|nr:phosphotransferase [Bacillus alkalicellulosilyticus]